MAFPTGWNRKCPLVIQSTLVGAALSGFPLLLTEDTLPAEMFDADGNNPAQNGGGDIRFSSDSAGLTQLPCEVVGFSTDNDPANGVAEIWVRVASVSPSSDTTIYVWYNTSGTETQPDLATTYGRDAVWSDFDLVAHLAEDPSGSAPQIADSTGNGYDGTSGGSMVTGDLVDATVGKGLDFEGTDDHVEFPATPFEYLSGFSVSLWVDANSVDQYDVLIANVPSDGTGWRLWTRDASTPKYYFEIRDALTNVYNVQSTTSILTGGPHHVVGVHDGSNLRIYVNGTEEGSATAADIGYGADNQLILGAMPLNTTELRRFFDGVLDEVRISDTVLSADWIASEYANQHNPGAFVVEGTPENAVNGGMGNPWYYFAQQGCD